MKTTIKQTKSFVRPAAVLAAMATISVLTLSGCATPSNFQAMTVAADAGMPELNPALKGTIKVQGVGGGKETNPMWTSQVDDASFKDALSGSLKNAGYLAPEGSAGQYALTATLQSLDQPMFGLTMEVKSNVLYKIEGAGKSKSLPITAVGSASPSDAFYGPTRLQMANERSILENIRAFIKALKDF